MLTAFNKSTINSKRKEKKIAKTNLLKNFYTIRRQRGEKKVTSFHKMRQGVVYDWFLWGTNSSDTVPYVGYCPNYWGRTVNYGLVYNNYLIRILLPKCVITVSQVLFPRIVYLSDGLQFSPFTGKEFLR